MTLTANFFQSIINSVTEHIVIIDESGRIEFVNSAWVEFGIANNSRHHSPKCWAGISYLNVCDASGGQGERHGSEVAEGTRKIISGDLGAFYHEYPCHSDTEKRWFMMRINQLQWQGPDRFIISHQNITERKLAESKVEALSLQDGLTKLPNRRHFDEFLAAEWRRGLRAGHPVSLALLDVDHFKLYNDHYGHLAGDQCLQQLGAAIGSVGKRPGDLAARYGGEEFALIMGNTASEAANSIAQQILQSINELAMPHAASPSAAKVGASIGVATLVPGPDNAADSLIETADQALYRAKSSGRNRVVTSPSMAWSDRTLSI